MLPMAPIRTGAQVLEAIHSNGWAHFSRTTLDLRCTAAAVAEAIVLAGGKAQRRNLSKAELADSLFEAMSVGKATVRPNATDTRHFISPDLAVAFDAALLASESVRPMLRPPPWQTDVDSVRMRAKYDKIFTALSATHSGSYDEDLLCNNLTGRIVRLNLDSINEILALAGADGIDTVEP